LIRPDLAKMAEIQPDLDGFGRINPPGSGNFDRIRQRRPDFAGFR
jgi:hypothetical protein